MTRLEIYPKGFFEVQLTFARKVAKVTKRPFEDAVLHYTAMYRILGLDWSADPTNPVWQKYVQALQQDVETGAEGTYQFYHAMSDSIPHMSDQPHWGCFVYDYLPSEHRVKIHFSNQDFTEYGALSHQRMNVRKAELKAMFTVIHEEHPDAEVVTGGSWLYNLQAYKRLFPKEYGQSAKAADKVPYLGRGLWGQFLNHEWQMNKQTAEVFLQRVEVATDIQQCDQSFPYQLLLPKAPITLFYQFYNI